MSAVEATRRWKLRQKARGLCAWCRRPATATYLCDHCKKRHNASQTEKRRQAKEAKEYW